MVIVASAHLNESDAALQMEGISEAEQARLESCVREPIRSPNSIQPHGLLLAVDRVSWRILQASENSLALVGRPAQALLGISLADLVGDAAIDQLSAVLTGDLTTANPVPVVWNADAFDAIVHAVGGVAVVELEPRLAPDEFTSVQAVYAALSRLGSPPTRDQLWDQVARELQLLTGFDRVMVYHFHPDGHGQVVAEQRLDESIESYLGLHYPASDIPAQARELYRTKVSRTIGSTAALSSPLIPAVNPLTGESLDASGAELRSVSPHHLHFMRNMGQAATLSFSLILDGELIGMITCAHRTPRLLPYSLRQALEALAGQVAMRLGAISDIERLAHTSELLALRMKLVEQHPSGSDPIPALLHGPVTIFDLVPASAAAILHERRLSITGPGLDRMRIQQFMGRLLAGGGKLPFSSESLVTEHPLLARIIPQFAGVLIVPIGADGDYVAWFRPEVVETVEWLGDQSDSNRDQPLSPRNSFSAWSGTVSGMSEPWGVLEGQAIELGRDLDGAFLRREESTLARLALRDALTGLHNRRFLIDRLEHALADHGRGGDIAALFIDIDSFKGINDSLGHRGGDILLTQIADRILSSVRGDDAVARIGGDEFVVLCEGTDVASARRIAHRLLGSLRQPFTVDGHNVRITASIGVAMARVGDTTADLLRRADASMYGAKRAGKDRTAE